MALRRRHIALALVEHFDVAAKRKNGQYPLGAVGAGTPLEQRTAEPHREALNLYVAPTRDRIMPQLVDEDEQPEADNEWHHIIKKGHQATSKSEISACARHLASASTASISSSDALPTPGMADITVSIVGAIAR